MESAPVKWRKTPKEGALMKSANRKANAVFWGLLAELGLSSVVLSSFAQSNGNGAPNDPGVQSGNRGTGATIINPANDPNGFTAFLRTGKIASRTWRRFLAQPITVSGQGSTQSVQFLSRSARRRRVRCRHQSPGPIRQQREHRPGLHCGHRSNPGSQNFRFSLTRTAP
jgi:hypothetical protein